MMLFDAEGKIRRYESPEAILEEFAAMRLQFYHKRKLSLLAVRALLRPHSLAREGYTCKG